MGTKPLNLFSWIADISNVHVTSNGGSILVTADENLKILYKRYAGHRQQAAIPHERRGMEQYRAFESSGIYWNLALQWRESSGGTGCRLQQYLYLQDYENILAAIHFDGNRQMGEAKASPICAAYVLSRSDHCA